VRRLCFTLSRRDFQKIAAIEGALVSYERGLRFAFAPVALESGPTPDRR
jgi:hypothetical protein